VPGDDLVECRLLGLTGSILGNGLGGERAVQVDTGSPQVAGGLAYQGLAAPGSMPARSECRGGRIWGWAMGSDGHRMTRPATIPVSINLLGPRRRPGTG